MKRLTPPGLVPVLRVVGPVVRHSEQRVGALLGDAARPGDRLVLSVLLLLADVAFDGAVLCVDDGLDVEGFPVVYACDFEDGVVQSTQSS